LVEIAKRERAGKLFSHNGRGKSANGAKR
jgi:hypothetical protein